MKLPMVVSPGTWDLIERLRPDLDVAVDVFDTRLAPLLAESNREWAVRLREVAGNHAQDGGRSHVRTALRSGRHSLFSEAGLRVGLFPIRLHQQVVGVLAAAAPETRVDAFADAAAVADLDAVQAAGAVTSANIVPDSDAVQGADSPRATATPDAAGDLLDRRIERVGWSLRAAVEADVALWERLDEAGHRARWAEATLRFLEFLHGCESDAEVFTALVQAAAVWGDLDARVYRRTLDDSYVVDSSLPTADVGDAPASFNASVVDGQPMPVRITALAELEQLGWRRVAPEVLLMPVGPADWPPMWLLALAGPSGGQFDSVSTTLARTASLRIEHLMDTRAAGITGRLRARLMEGHRAAPEAIAVLLRELLAALPVSQARLLAHDPGSNALRPLASAGGVLFEVYSGPVPAGAAGISPERLLLPLALDEGPPAILELTAPAAARFSPADAFVAQKVARWLEAWLAGVWRGLAASAPRRKEAGPCLGAAQA